jgi:hypothetical protein
MKDESKKNVSEQIVTVKQNMQVIKKSPKSLKMCVSAPLLD